MKSTLALAVLLGCAAVMVSAQSPSSAFPRGSSLQAWQNPGFQRVVDKCKNRPQPFSLAGAPPANPNAAPSEPAPPPASTAIPGAAGQNWKVVWSWEGNNADGIIAIVLYGAWGTPSARNRVIAIPTIAEGYKDRAK